MGDWQRLVDMEIGGIIISTSRHDLTFGKLPEKQIVEDEIFILTCILMM